MHGATTRGLILLLIMPACDTAKPVPADTGIPEDPDAETTSGALVDCAGDIAGDVPAFYQDFFACVDASMTGGDVTLGTDGLPPHPSPYYAQDHPLYVEFDTRGGTHYRNPNQLAEQSVSFVIPSDPVPKGIDITAALVDNTMMTSDEEFGGGPQGIALDGVLIFAAMAAPGDDLWAEQFTFDLYEGHPAGTAYHYHFETPGPLEVLQHRGFTTTATPGDAEVELYGMMCDGTVVMGCTELDGTPPGSAGFDAQNGHVHDIEEGTTKHFSDRYHTHVCPDAWTDHPFFPEIAYYEQTNCPAARP